MNKPENLIWDSIYHGAIKSGATEKAANDQAVMGTDDYKRGKIPKPGGVSKLVKNRINLAKKQK